MHACIYAHTHIHVHVHVMPACMHAESKKKNVANNIKTLVKQRWFDPNRGKFSDLLIVNNFDREKYQECRKFFFFEDAFTGM